MSYTAPNNIQTKADAIIALASTLADEDLSARGDGTVNTALDVLADQMAGSDVDVPPTNSGAILELAQYVSQGGGGGAVMGTLFVPSASAAGTFTVDGTAVEFTEEQFGDYTARVASIPAGTIVTFTPSGSGSESYANVSYWTLEQLELDGSPEFAEMMTSIKSSNHPIGFAIASGLITDFLAS